MLPKADLCSFNCHGLHRSILRSSLIVTMLCANLWNIGALRVIVLRQDVQTLVSKINRKDMHEHNSPFISAATLLHATLSPWWAHLCIFLAPTLFIIIMHNCDTWWLTLTKTRVPSSIHEFCRKGRNNAKSTLSEMSTHELAFWRVPKILSMSFQWSRHFKISIWRLSRWCSHQYDRNTYHLLDSKFRQRSYNGNIEPSTGRMEDCHEHAYFWGQINDGTHNLEGKIILLLMDASTQVSKKRNQREGNWEIPYLSRQNRS